MIKYQNKDIPVFSIPPDWRQSIKFSERYGNLIFEALSTAEERIETQPRPLFKIDYNTLTLSEQETGYIRKVIESASAMPVAMPVWQFKRRIIAAPTIGNLFTACDNTSDAMFDTHPFSIIWKDFQTFEAFQTFAVGPNEIQFAQPITKQFAVGDYVVPMILGFFPRKAASALTDANGEFPVSFEEKFLVECFATPNLINANRINHQPGFEYLLTGGPIL